MPASHANLAVGKIVNAPGNSGVTIELEGGNGSRFPSTTPYPAFVFPEGQIPTPINCEIVEVTARAGDKLTVTRKSEAGSGSLNMVAGLLIISGPTVKTFTDIETSITAEVARASMQEGELAGLLSEAQGTNEELAARVSVLEARIGGISGTGKPIVTTLPLVGATHTPETMTMKGEVNPNGAATEWWLEYGETEALGNVSSKVSAGSGTSASAVEKTVTAASPGTLTAGLFFRVVAKNSNGETRGAIMQPSPTITERPTLAYGPTPITNVSTGGFTGNAIFNANGEATTVTLEWGTTTGYGTIKTFGETPSDRIAHNASIAATGLSLVAGTTYHYRIKAVNAIGTTNLADGTFTVGTTNETLLGEPSTPAGGNEDKDSKGRVEAFPFTVAKTGTLKEIKFNKSKVSDGGTITKVFAGVLADDGSGKPVTATVLAEGSKTPGEEATIATTGTVTIPLGSTLAVTAGEKLWIALLPIAGRLWIPAATNGIGGAQQYQSTPSGTEYAGLTGVAGWEGGAGREAGPCQVWGVGTTTVVSNVPTLTLASNKEEVEWASLGSETTYELRISKQPSTVEGRIAAIFSQAKTANPQKFKPKANTTYGSSPQVTIPPGSTAYMEVRLAGTTTWSNAIGVALAGEAVTVLKGVEMGGWGPTEEIGDMEEGKINVIRLNKPSAARTAELEAKGIKVVYLYAYDTGGQNKSGVKAINRTAWVADAIKRIKEVKPKYFECLNEPGGSWFWGGEAGNAAEAEAYVNLLKLLWEEVQKLPAEERPKIIASLDGGKSTSKEYVEKLKAANASFTSYFDYGSCHAYYKVGGNSTGKLGNRGNILAIYNYLGKAKKITVTEIGWPTLKETGDSYKYTEAEQAEAVGGFLAWTKSAESETAVVLTIIYGYRDGSGEPPGYGLWHIDDSPKPAVPKLASA